jgi:hypothetical protein
LGETANQPQWRTTNKRADINLYLICDHHYPAADTIIIDAALIFE